ncbi:hypothetical protein [Methylobacterium sp. MA0201]|uniref:hypothetical protein n=1 Tax=Methylobacterium alsaeris TaxID=3344826 RepID=UPI0037570034
MREAFELEGIVGEPVTVTLRRTGAREWIDHIVRLGEANGERAPRPRFEGNRRARRKAAAQARRGVYVMPPVRYPEPNIMRVGFAEAEQAEATRRKRLAEHLEFTREWRAVQALEGRIVDEATPEQRAAREAALSEEWDHIRQAEEASDAVSENSARPKPGRDADLPHVGSFYA